MKNKAIVTITAVGMVSQLFGCAAANKAQVQSVTEEVPRIEVEVASTVPEEIRKAVEIKNWKPVGEYTNNEELRTTWENMLVITKDASGEKTGAFYTGKGNDVTLKDALTNVDFAHTLKESDISSLLETVYIDADSISSEMSRAALINGYFNLLDTTNGFYNSSLMITQEEYLNALVKAASARKAFSYTDSESITEQELIANSLRAKYSLKTGTYITIAEAHEILSKELGVVIDTNTDEAGENLTRGEAINLIVNTMIEKSGISEEFIVVEPEPEVEEPVQQDNTASESYNEPAQSYSGGYSMSEEERQALLDKARKANPNLKSGNVSDHLTDKGEYDPNIYIPGDKTIHLH